MIVLHTWGTINGRKPIMLLEELGLGYEIRPVDIGRGEQNTPAFRRLNPVGKIPVLVQDESLVMFESNAILMHLAVQTGRLVGEGPAHDRVVQWLFFQAATAGPILGAYWRRKHTVPEGPAAEFDHQRAEAERVVAALEMVLSDTRYLAGDFSIADMAMVQHIRRELAEPEHADRWPAVRTWIERCEARPSVATALAVEIGRPAA